MAEMKCLVVTPEETAVEEVVTSVALPLYDGEIAVLNNHAPMIGRMGYGELRLISPSGETHRYYVDGGFVQVADNVISVMTNHAVPAKSLNVDELETALHDAQQIKANSDETFELRDQAVVQSRAKLRIARKA